MRQRLLSLAFVALMAWGVVVTMRATQVPKTDAPVPSFSGLNSLANAQKSGVAIVQLYGAIQTSGSPSMFGGPTGGADSVIERLKELAKDKRVKAVVLRINSPGGTVGASQELHQQIINLRQAGKPVVASVADMAASGGYYAACGANKIYANPGSLVGSIGVIMSVPSLEGLLEWAKIDYKNRVITSGKYKDIGAQYREMRPEERKQLQTIVDTTYGQFLNAVVEGRKHVDPASIKEHAQGQIFTGEQAKENGLVDEVGSLQDAIKAAAELANIKGDPHIIHRQPKDIFDMLNQLNVTKQDPLGVKAVVERVSGLRLEYMYYPGL